MKTRRNLCLTLTLALLLGLMAGCGGGNATGETTGPAASQAESTPPETTESQPTEPLPTEINSWYQDYFYIGDSVRTYDRAGNLIKEEQDFRYEDGRTKVGYTCYTADGVEIESHYTECFSDGALQYFYHYKHDEAGNPTYMEIESYYDNRQLEEKTLRVYDPERDVWNISAAWYKEDGSFYTFEEGIFEGEGLGLIEGIAQRYSDETDTLLEEQQKNADGSGHYHSYYEDGSPNRISDTTFDPETNTLKTVSTGYTHNGTVVDYDEKEETFDADGNCTNRNFVFHDYDGDNDTYSGKQMSEEAYDAAGNVIKSTSCQYDQNDVLTGKSEMTAEYDANSNLLFRMTKNYETDGTGTAVLDSHYEETYKYDAENRVIWEKDYTHDPGIYTHTDERTYEYNAQGLMAKRHDVSEMLDANGDVYAEDIAIEYTYNSQNQLIMEHHVSIYPYGSNSESDYDESITTIEYEYDEHGWLAVKTTCTTDGTYEYVDIEYNTYDENGVRTQVRIVSSLNGHVYRDETYDCDENGDRIYD